MCGLVIAIVKRMAAAMAVGRPNPVDGLGAIGAKHALGVDEGVAGKAAWGKEVV
ncbi:MAG: hypothetical protein IPP74_01090 [Alphaproteobacteria bacterium]|nr:hypothetical protein [Alphaproteobacteria bacterium]